MDSLKRTFFEASDLAIAQAASFGIAFALCVNCAHMFMLNSRVAASSVSAAAVVTLLALVCISTGKPEAPPASQRRCAIVCDVVYVVASAVFLMAYLPMFRSACFCAVFASAASLTVCEAMRLRSFGTRTAMLAVLFGVVVGMCALLIIAGVGSVAGLRSNVSNYTVYGIVSNILLAALWAIALVVQNRMHPSVEKNRPSNARLASGHNDDASDEALRNDDPLSLVTTSEEEFYILTAGARYDVATLAILATICAMGASAAFFDGFTFNPHIRDTIAIDIIRFAVVGIGAAALFAMIARSDDAVPEGRITIASTVIICIGIAGIVVLSIESPGLTALGIIASSIAHDLLLLCGILMAFMLNPATERQVVCALSCAAFTCGGPPLLAAGMYAKIVVGFSISTATPLVVAAIALLTVASLAANARTAKSARDMRASRDAALARDEAFFSTVRRSKAMEAIEELSAASLSQREREAGMLAMTGASNQEIASQMGISEKTVAYHLSNFYKKTGVKGKAELVSRAHDLLDTL